MVHYFLAWLTGVYKKIQDFLFYSFFIMCFLFFVALNYPQDRGSFSVVLYVNVTVDFEYAVSLNIFLFFRVPLGFGRMMTVRIYFLTYFKHVPTDHS